MNLCEFKTVVMDYTRKINENTNAIFNPIYEQYGLTVLQLRILLELYKHESLTIGSLAEGILVTGTNMSSMCKKMESMGLLKRVRDQNDERVVKVSLTDRGNKIVSDIDRFIDEKISKACGHEIEKTLDVITEGIRKLNDLMQNIISEKSK